MLAFDLSCLPPGLRVGTSSFSSPDWCGSFYPPGLPADRFLSHYATVFDTVEIDATWHAMPLRRTVRAWAEKVPDGFVFSLKVPKVVTHERALEGCADDWRRFLEVLEPLEGKLGPILFQFPYAARGADPEEYRAGTRFLRRLEAFLPQLPEGPRYVVEVRNRSWLSGPLPDLLRSRRIALALASYTTMPAPHELFGRCDPITSDFAYIRFLGNHRSMDDAVARARAEGVRRSDWGEILADRSADTRQWISAIRDLFPRVPEIYVYFNNHYAGFAPGSIELFLRLWRENRAATRS